MKRNILCTLAVMAACAILVACGKTDDQISPITPESNAASSEAEATPEPTPVSYTHLTLPTKRIV